ncbi:MAG: threonine--tRNA ligase [Alteromonadaceae bacterium]|nr:threonine--tRNA ligase [Alteromonadaceae bacterium]
MPVVTLPDGSQRTFDTPVTVLDVAADIGAGLAAATIAGQVNGQLMDASDLVRDNSSLRIITSRDSEGLDIIRHSCAHLVGHAVKQLFPEAKMVIGPVIEDGFYYDIAIDEPFLLSDLEKIENRMLELAKTDYAVVKKVMPRDAVIDQFLHRGEDFKLRLIDEMPNERHMALYFHEEYVDMCRGPHVPNTKFLRHFKLTKISGAYWRGDAKNQQLQRIYGTAWAEKKQLKVYLNGIAEAEKRDHRKIGKKLDLFHTQEEAPGMVFWHPAGWSIYQSIERYMREKQRAFGYQEIKTPQVVDIGLWQRSGHADKFADGMFTLEAEERQFAVKPMNCPCHVQVFNQGLKSYRDLPLRLAEFGSCHRNEPSGSLHGIMRVRGFTQDDAHIFCTEEQIQPEVSQFIDMLHEVYADFGFSEVIYRLSTRPSERVGSDEDWDRAEAALAEALNAKRLPWEELPGEGAFYGPKIEFSLKDCIGRIWQLGTIQVDFSMPGRLDAQYVAEDGARKVPVMLHRAVLGSFERFIGILIEHYEGAFPVWLAPKQAVVVNITDKHAAYATEVAERLQTAGFRAEADLRNEKIGFKIRELELAKVPYVVVVGDKEMASSEVSVRARHGQDLGSLTKDALLEMLASEVARKGRGEAG